MTLGFQHIYLASGSPRRRELLKQIGVAFEPLLLRTQPPRTDVEELPHPEESPEDYVVRVARAKAEAGWLRLYDRKLPKSPVLAADTAIFLDGEIIGKPGGRERAEATLRRLSGRRHQVLTGVALAYEDRIEAGLSVTAVDFGEVSEAEIRRYAAGGEPWDKAGAYAIQGRAGAFVARIEGSYSGVMGLPLYETAQLLRQFDVSPL